MAMIGVFIGRATNLSVFVLGGSRIHVDVETGRRNLVANRVLNPHGKRVSIFEGRFGIGGDMHHRDQLAPNPADAHVVNGEDATD